MNKKNEQNLCSVKIWSITNRRWPWLKVILGLLLILIVLAVILAKILGDNSRLRENNSVVNSEAATNKVTIKDEFRVDWRDDKTKNTKIQKGKRKIPKRTTVELKNNLKSRDLKRPSQSSIIGCVPFRWFITVAPPMSTAMRIRQMPKSG